MLNRLVACCVAVLVVSGCNTNEERIALRIRDEAAGSNCTSGGVAVETGIDANRDGTLSDDEVSGDLTRFVCDGSNGMNGSNGTNGSNGSNGINGFNGLSKVTAEPAGANCANGGTRVDSGIDANADGVLDTAEISSTAYVCTPSVADETFYGNLEIRSAADLALLQNVRTLVGDLTIVEAPGGVLSLPNLRVLSGELYLYEGYGTDEGSAAPVPTTSLSFPKLERIGRIDLERATNLTTLSFPELKRSGDIYLYELNSLTSLTFPKLEVAGDVAVTRSAQLATLAFPLLQSADDFEVYGHTSLTSLSAPMLRSVSGSLSISNDQMLSHCLAKRLYAQLTSVPRYRYFDDLNTMPTCVAADLCRMVTVSPFSKPIASCFESQTFATAQTTCATLGAGANLLWLSSAAEASALSTAVNDSVLVAGWIGATDATTEGTFVWLGGGSTYDLAANTSFWLSGEPAADTARNGVFVGGNGKAYTEDVTTQGTFLCRVP